ncbi:ferritin, middle subunit-like [Hemiscyllium ocellatum]|uniref:ferritin, middle subunit-like n=1 Tax=Hemiscyllium ocellatum TaxID=170820 RepID=UPI0029660C76|nr:ferritin, middle subunit-like [Hemiscyllium ocellatum]
MASVRSSYFDRDDVALRHFDEFFKEQSHEEREHAEKRMEFQNKRGGRVLLQDVKKPEQDEWGNGLGAMQRALQMEKDVNQSLLDLHKLSSGHTDPHLCDFLEREYLDEQVKMIVIARPPVFILHSLCDTCQQSICLAYYLDTAYNQSVLSTWVAM